MNININFDKDFVSFFNGEYSKNMVINGVWNELLKLEGIDKSDIDFISHYNDVIKNGSETSIDHNSNSSLVGMRFHIKELRETFSSLQKIIGIHSLFCSMRDDIGVERTSELFNSWINGDIYLHDSCYLLVPYCYSISVEPIVSGGMIFNKRLISIPPKHTRSFIGQVAETVISMSQELAGALAIADVFIYYYYFLTLENKVLNWNDREFVLRIINDFQNLVHILNAPHRYSGQSPFTNISIFDFPTLNSLFGSVVYLNGTKPDMDNIMKLQKIFCDWFSKGQLQNDNFLPYPFPIVTLNIKIDENKNIIDKDTFDYFCNVNKKGLFNFFVSDSNKIASCCRVVNNINTHMSIFGDGGINIGSLRVVTINLARLGYLASRSSDPKSELYKLLDNKMKNSYDLLINFKRFINKRISENACPFFSDNMKFMFMERFFLTFGINGLNECLNEMGYDITTPIGFELSKEILKYINDYANSKSDVKTKTLFNVEQVPGESLAFKHAQKDRLLYNMNYKIYSNQFVPLWKEVDIETRMKIDGELTKYMSGGSITHINMTEELDVDQLKKIVLFAINCKCEHFSINYSYNTCKNNHITISGNSEMCPICSEKIIERTTRIVGYFTQVSSWSPIRRDEFYDRKFS